MKRNVLLTAAACVVLSFPAIGQAASNGSSQPSTNQQQSQTTGNSQAGNQTQQQNPSQMQASNGQQQQSIQPSSLNKQDLREIQRNLNRSGFKVGRADGIWGRKTEHALRGFQQSKNLPGNGQLNEQTLSALGVDINNQAQAQNGTGKKSQQGQSQTVGQSPSSQTVGQSHNGQPSGSPKQGK